MTAKNGSAAGAGLLAETARPSRPEFVPSAGAHEVLDVLGLRIHHVTPLNQGDGDYCVIEATLPPAGMVLAHGHDDRETFYVLSGELQGLKDDGWTTLRSGNVFDVPGGVMHAFLNMSGVPVSMLIVTTVRMGRFLYEAGRPARSLPSGPPTDAELQRFFKLALKYGYWLASPEENAAFGLPAR
ncbi:MULTISPECIES: cupin domain-containing protein [Rhodomicrobium]|uniref:cupin domain-containing protein n=1 Tax=Rhodomicrobium TaxID=1068 RepID=UPI000B4AABBE|nr:MULTISPECIES: cupin domain-containing protein [Rhodomicrobium]